MDARQILEHLPFVMAAGSTGPQLDLKDLVGAIVIGVVSAMGSSYITTKELAVEMRVLTKQMERMQTQVENFGSQHQAFAERLTRLEAGNGKK